MKKGAARRKFSCNPTQPASPSTKPGTMQIWTQQANFREQSNATIPSWFPNWGRFIWYDFDCGIGLLWNLRLYDLVSLSLDLLLNLNSIDVIIADEGKPDVIYFSLLKLLSLNKLILPKLSFKILFLQNDKLAR